MASCNSEELYKRVRQFRQVRGHHRGGRSALASRPPLCLAGVILFSLSGALEATAVLFGPAGGASEPAPAIDAKLLHTKIGALTLENDFLSSALSKAGLWSAKR
jgi:hypothetical protein